MLVKYNERNESSSRQISSIERTVLGERDVADRPVSQLRPVHPI